MVFNYVDIKNFSVLISPEVKKYNHNYKTFFTWQKRRRRDGCSDPIPTSENKIFEIDKTRHRKIFFKSHTILILKFKYRLQKSQFQVQLRKILYTFSKNIQKYINKK